MEICLEDSPPLPRCFIDIQPRLWSISLEQYVEFSEADGLIFTKNEREYPKTEGAIPSGRSPRGIAPEVFGYSLEF